MEKYGKNFIKSKSGVWYSKEHHDLKFLDHEETDWVDIASKSFWYKHRNKIFLEILSKFKPTGIMFEIGAGFGSVSLAAQEAGYPIIALEPTVKLAESANSRGVKNVICSKIEEAGFERGIFGCVGIFDVLEHIEDDIKFLSEVRSLMPYGGRLYCAVPIWKFLWSSEDVYADHFRRYSPKKLNEIIKNAGFKIEYQSYYFLILFFPILILRALLGRFKAQRKRTAESVSSDHILKNKLILRFINLLLKIELKMIRFGVKIPFGSSYIVVAKAN
jgi:SAM-dependent methyltransferase